MNSGRQGHRVRRHPLTLPADVADRIMRALEAESASRAKAQFSGSAAPVAVPRQRRVAGQSPACYCYVPRPCRSSEPA